MPEKRNPYQLSNLADCYSPDTADTAGAQFLLSVQDRVLDAIAEGYTLERAQDSGRLHEIADAAPDIYTHTRWQEFADLGAFNENPSDLGSDGSDMTAAAGICLYIIAERLAVALFEEFADEEPDEVLCRHCAEPITEDDNGAGGKVWVHDFGSTVCYDDPPGSHEDGDATTCAEPEPVEVDA